MVAFDECAGVKIELNGEVYFVRGVMFEIIEQLCVREFVPFQRM